MASEAWAAVTRVALRQDHALSMAQARRVGASSDQVARMVAAGLLDRPERGVLRIAGAPVTWRQRLRVATLRVGDDAVVAGRSAAMLHGLEGVRHPGIDLVVPPGHRRRPRRGTVRESVDLERADLVSIDGFRATSATRTLVDLGEVVPEVALDDALRRGLTTQDRLWAMIHRLARPGRSGVPQLRELLVSRGDVEGLTETGFETLLLRALRDAALPRPATQHEIRDGEGAFVMRVDAAYVAERVGIEADSRRWHGTDGRFESDREKRAIAAALGWTIVPVTYRQVTTRPTWVGWTVAGTLRSAAGRSVA